MKKEIILIGCGGFGETWILAIKKFDLYVEAIVEINDEVREKYRKFYHISKEHAYDSIDKVPWEQLTAELVIDCTPPRERVRCAERVIQSGKRLLTTKPAANSFKELYRLIELSKESEKKIYVAQQKRYFPAYIELKKLTEENKLGKLSFAEIYLRCDGLFWRPGEAWRRTMDYPSLLDGSIHHFDLLNQIIGKECKSILATSWNTDWSPFTGNADFQSTMKFEDNITVHYLSRWAPQKNSKVIHYFSGFRLEFENGVAEVIDGKLYINQQYSPISGDGEEYMELDKLNCILFEDLYEKIEHGDADGNHLEISNHYMPFAMMMGTMEAIENKREINMFEFLTENYFKKIVANKVTKGEYSEKGY